MAATNSSVTGSTTLIPRFVVDRDRYASSQGLSAVSTIRRDEDGEIVIETTWAGPESAFWRIGLLRRSQPAPLGVKPRGMCIGTHPRWSEGGRIYRGVGGEFTFIIRTELPLAVEELEGGLERCTFPEDWRYASRVAYHGPEDALRAAGILRTAKRPWKRTRNGRGWRAELQPDGQILYWLLADRVLVDRQPPTAPAAQPRRSHLRLVVNNTNDATEPGPFSPRPVA